MFEYFFFIIDTGLVCALHLVVKKKSCPATHHGGTWGERRYSSYSLLTSTLDGGEWSASRPPKKKLPLLPQPLLQLLALVLTAQAVRCRVDPN
jgi:hypothetical protein